MMVDLHATNVLLGIMAVVSIIEVLIVIALGVAGFVVYRKVIALVGDLEQRQIAPLREKVETILADVQVVTARVSQQTERVDHAITGTMDRVDETAERMKTSMRDKAIQAVGVARGVRAVIASLLNHESRPKPPHAAAGRA
ncbi:MAG TPA: hypothetical protein VFX12_15325 [Vicinamibacterales bacterium]|nr:hypothetical protein [Vicinamibacterales bacterium]